MTDQNKELMTKVTDDLYAEVKEANPRDLLAFNGIEDTDFFKTDEGFSARFNLKDGTFKVGIGGTKLAAAHSAFNAVVKHIRDNAETFKDHNAID